MVVVLVVVVVAERDGIFNSCYYYVLLFAEITAPAQRVNFGIRQQHGSW